MKDLLVRWNPWWVTGKVPKDKKLILRESIISEIISLMNPKEAIILTGVRRSGKSTIIYQLIDSLMESIPEKNILYFNFDEPIADKDINTIESVFTAFLELNNPKGRKYIFFDEIQSIKGWEQWIKKYYDLYGSDIKFVITGSNSSMLSSNLSKLLTGRIFTKCIFPLSFKEFLDFKGIKVKSLVLQKEEIRHYFSDYLNKGGFPEVVLEEKKELNERRLREYFDGIIFRDILSAKNVRETAKLTELAYYALTNISTELSYSKISSATKININTLREYLNYFEEAYLLFQLRYFSYSVKESIRVQMPRKIYCIDNGLRNAAGFRFSKDLGRLAENAVMIELKRRGEETYYWKSQRNHEVDFVVKAKDGHLSAINVTYTDKIDEREAKSLNEFRKNFNKAKELVILTDDLEKNEGGIQHIPLWKWLLIG